MKLLYDLQIKISSLLNFWVTLSEFSNHGDAFFVYSFFIATAAVARGFVVFSLRQNVISQKRSVNNVTCYIIRSPEFSHVSVKETFETRKQNEEKKKHFRNLQLLNT